MGKARRRGKIGQKEAGSSARSTLTTTMNNSFSFLHKLELENGDFSLLVMGGVEETLVKGRTADFSLECKRRHLHNPSSP